MNRKAVVVVLALVALLMTTSIPVFAGLGVSADIGFGRSVTQFELGRGFYVSIAAVINGERKATAHTSRGVSIRTPRELMYEVRFTPQNIQKLKQVWMIISPSGDEIEMKLEDYNNDGVPDRFVAVLFGEDLPKDDCDITFRLRGRFDKETKQILIFTDSGKKMGTTEQSIPITAVNVHPGLETLNPDEYCQLHLRRMGWLLLDEYVQRQPQIQLEQRQSPPVQLEQQDPELQEERRAEAATTRNVEEESETEVEVTTSPSPPPFSLTVKLDGEVCEGRHVVVPLERLEKLRIIADFDEQRGTVHRTFRGSTRQVAGEVRFEGGREVFTLTNWSRDTYTLSVTYKNHTEQISVEVM